MTRKRRVTSSDVAKLAGISRTTVSFVLNNVAGVNISEPTRQAVIDAARQLNYHPDEAALSLVSGKSRTIGLVLRQSHEQVFADAFLPQVILGMGQATEKRGFHIMVVPLAPDDNSSNYTSLIHRNRVDGIVLSGPRSDDKEVVELYKSGVPIMLMGQLPGSEIPVVDINTVDGANKVIKHLVDLGHRDIAMISNAPFEYTSAQQRLTGYRNALEDANIIYETQKVKAGNFTPASGFTAMEELLSYSSRPSAVFVASDVVALGAIQAAKRAGLRIPQDISIVGFDDIPLAAYFDPALTTIRLPAYALGWAVGDRLTALIQGEQLMNHELFMDTDLVIRESSSRAP